VHATDVNDFISSKDNPFEEEKFASLRGRSDKMSRLKLRCDERFTHSFTACGCV